MGGRILGLMAVAVVAVSGNAKADDLAAVKQEIAESRHQHAELLKRLEKFEKRQAVSRQSRLWPIRVRASSARSRNPPRTLSWARS